LITRFSLTFLSPLNAIAVNKNIVLLPTIKSNSPIIKIKVTILNSLNENFSFEIFKQIAIDPIKNATTYNLLPASAPNPLNRVTRNIYISKNSILVNKISSFEKYHFLIIALILS
jgi:hypothetical protein